MCVLESTVSTLSQILKDSAESAIDIVCNAAGAQGFFSQRDVVMAPHSPTPGLLRACLAAAADAFAVVEAFVWAAAAGFAGDFTPPTLEIALGLLFAEIKGVVPLVSLCWQEDHGRSARSLYSLMASCLKLHLGAPLGRLAAAQHHATWRMSRAAVMLLQEHQWPTGLLPADTITPAEQGAAAGRHDPASRLPSVVLLGRCLLHWTHAASTSPMRARQLPGASWRCWWEV